MQAEITIPFLSLIALLIGLVGFGCLLAIAIDHLKDGDSSIYMPDPQERDPDYVPEHFLRGGQE